MNYCNVIIDNKKVVVPEGTTLLEAARMVSINIPTLCYHPDQEVKANCRICVAEVKGKGNLVATCSTFVWEGADILTNSKKVMDTRRDILELILASHPKDCLKCIRNGKCELQTLCKQFNMDGGEFDNIAKKSVIDDSNPSIVRDESKCVKCNRCVEMCETVQGVGAICNTNRSSNISISTAYKERLEDSQCIYCGQCTSVCPVGALYEKDNTKEAWEAINDENKHVIVQVAPAVRVSLGEEFNLPAGEDVTGKMVAALKRIGFNKVFDTNFTADLTIMEEGEELVHRIKNKGVLPMITSCCPGWVNYAEINSQHILEHLSTCKSPQQMFGALSKSYYAGKIGIKPEHIVTISIMPCTAKKYEASREEMNVKGVKEVDIVLTTRELGRMINAANIDFENIEKEEFDTPFGIVSGAGAIFGVTGGVMEAALRTVYHRLTNEVLKSIEFKDVRGMEGIKEASIIIDNFPVKFAVAHGMSNAKKIIEQIERGESEYTFVEIMACSGGCIGGGGQPIGTTLKVKEKRMGEIYKIDCNKSIRQSHKNEAIIKLYKEFLGKPLGDLSHDFLHTSYHKREK